MDRLRNLLGAVPLIAWFGWILSQEVPAFLQAYGPRAGEAITPLFAFQALSQTASILFTSLLILLLIIRTVPKGRVGGPLPYAAAATGTFAASSLFLLPIVPPSVPVAFAAALLTTTGLVLSVYALIYLGESLAMLPSARNLIVDGPYRFIRHPLYLFEEITILGVMIQFAQPWAILIVVAHFSAQLVRMRYEEQVLTETFPEYTEYAAHTSRLIPGIY